MKDQDTERSAVKSGGTRRIGADDAETHADVLQGTINERGDVTGGGNRKLGKGTAFVTTHIKRLKQGTGTWEADFRATPKPHGQSETHCLGLVVALPDRNPRALIPVEYTPDVNDPADLLAAARRRPMTDEAGRPRRIVFRANPRWEELFPHRTRPAI